MTRDRRGHVEQVTHLVSKAREGRRLQVFGHALSLMSVLFHTKDMRLCGDFLGSRKWSKDRLQFLRMAFIFVRRGHGEFIHTRRSRESDPRAGRTPSPVRAIAGDSVLRCLNLKKTSAYGPSRDGLTSLTLQLPHRSGRATSSRGLRSPFPDQTAGN